MSREVVVVSGVRTAIGTFGGSLKDIAPTELGAQVVREALKRANTDGKDVGHASLFFSIFLISLSSNIPAGGFRWQGREPPAGIFGERERGSARPPLSVVSDHCQDLISSS